MDMEDSGAEEMRDVDPKENVNIVDTGEQASAYEESSANTEESGTGGSGTEELEKPESEPKVTEYVPDLEGIKYRARIADNHATRMAVNRLKVESHYIAADDATKRMMEERTRNDVMAYRKRKGIDYQTKVDKALGNSVNTTPVTQRAVNEALLNYAAPVPENPATGIDTWFQQLAASSRYGRGQMMPRAAEPPKPKKEKRSRISELQAFRAHEARMESDFLTDDVASNDFEGELEG